MNKIFCNHCGKEVKGIDVNELAYGNCFYDYETHKFIGYGCVLCKKCWNKRNQIHINLDRKFLNMVEEETDIDIKDTMIPEECSQCLFVKLSPTGESLICDRTLSRVPWDGKPFDCPFNGVQESYGRLIDADALPISTAVSLDGKPYQYIHIDNIKAAPTIIPASKKEKVNIYDG